MSRSEYLSQGCRSLVHDLADPRCSSRVADPQLASLSRQSQASQTQGLLTVEQEAKGQGQEQEQEQGPAVPGRADRCDHPLTEVVRRRLPASVRPAVAMRRLPAAAAVVHHRAVRRGPCAR